MKVVIDVKAINVGRYKKWRLKKDMATSQSPYLKKQKKFDYYRCYVSIFN